jgi:hypothetical protein
VRALDEHGRRRVVAPPGDEVEAVGAAAERERAGAVADVGSDELRAAELPERSVVCVDVLLRVV